MLTWESPRLTHWAILLLPWSTSMIFLTATSMSYKTLFIMIPVEPFSLVKHDVLLSDLWCWVLENLLTRVSSIIWVFISWWCSWGSMLQAVCRWLIRAWRLELFQQKAASDWSCLSLVSTKGGRLRRKKKSHKVAVVTCWCPRNHQEYKWNFTHIIGYFVQPHTIKIALIMFSFIMQVWSVGIV